MLAAHAGDAERQMDALRHFQHAQTFRLLAQDLAGTLTVERLADHLSALADIDPRRDARRRCGRTCTAAPRRRRRRSSRSSATASSAARSSGYASDLDLVFLYDDADDEPAPTRYTRLAQTPHHLAHQHHGRRPALRHRPAAAARRREGLLASSLAGFRRYQREQAWTWEHQALTRARFVAGDAAIGAGVRGRARGDPAPAARSATLCARRRRDAPENARRAIPNPTRAVRREARRRRHGRRRVRRPVPGARARARPPGADAERRQHRAARLAAELGLVPQPVAAMPRMPIASTGGSSTRSG